MSASARHSDLLTIACHALLSRWVGDLDFSTPAAGTQSHVQPIDQTQDRRYRARLVVLMVATSILSLLMASRVGHLLDELTNKYVPAYGDLARANVRSLERALALRQAVIAKMQTPPDDAAFAERLQTSRTKDAQVAQEADAARKLIVSIIEDPSTPSDNVTLARIDNRIEAAVTDVRRLLNEDDDRLISQLEARDFAEVQRSLTRVDALRNEFSQKIDQIRADMLAQVHASAITVMADQQRAIWITVIVTAIAAILGLLFAGLISTGITRPVRLLLQGTREVEAGQLDRLINVVTRDEIGQLSAAFNRMVDQLRHKEQIRQTFGRYIDPRGRRPDRSVRGGGHRRSTSGDDGHVLRHERVHGPERRHDAARPRQGDEPLPLDYV